MAVLVGRFCAVVRRGSGVEVSAPFVIGSLIDESFWTGHGRWSQDLDEAAEYETREDAEKQSRRLGMPERVVIVRSTAKRMAARWATRRSSEFTSEGKKP